MYRVTSIIIHHLWQKLTKNCATANFATRITLNEVSLYFAFVFDWVTKTILDLGLMLNETVLCEDPLRAFTVIVENKE